MTDFNFEKYKGKYVVMHCKTEEEAIDFCRVMHNAGKSWCTGRIYLNNTAWNIYKEDTCYNFNEGSYSNYDWFNANKNYTILKWSDFMKISKEFTMTNLKNNDIVTLRDGNQYMYNEDFDAFVNTSGYILLSSYDDELKAIHRSGYTFYAEFDIIKISRPTEVWHLCEKDWNAVPVIWTREKVVEMTMEEVCKALGKNIKIVK